MAPAAGAVRLRSPGGEVEAVVRPDHGMAVASLRHRGEEVLGAQSAIADPVLREAMLGIPFLHPWANRLSRDRFTFAGREARIPAGAPFVPRDGAGVPLHGLVAAPGAWAARPAPGGDGLRAEMRFPADPRRAAAFPFPHRVALDLAALDDGLEVTARVEPAADVEVPVAFGFHPYLRLPAGARAGWSVELPAMIEVIAERGLPTGRTRARPARTEALGDRTWDESYAGVAPGAELAVTDGRRRIAVRLVSGFRAAQVYAPAEDDVVCLEPMTAPLDALVHGDGLPSVLPGTAFSATFRVVVQIA